MMLFLSFFQLDMIYFNYFHCKVYFERGMERSKSFRRDFIPLNVCKCVLTIGRFIKKGKGCTVDLNFLRFSWFETKCSERNSSYSGVMGPLKGNLGKRDCARAQESPIKVF